MKRILLSCLAVALTGLFSSVKANYNMSFNTSSAMNQMSCTYSSSDSTYSIVTKGTDPYVYLTALSRALETGEARLIFEYKSTTGLSNLSVYYGNSFTELRSAWLGNLSQATEWKTAIFDITGDITSLDWGKKGDVLRMDFGTASGKVLQIKNPRIEAITPNIKGRVYCSGVGMEGVVVSDGYVLTKTDADGYYSFYTNKKNGYVFCEIPSGYMPRIKASTATNEQRIFPQFWYALKYPGNIAKVETFNFEMSVENNTNFRLFAGADPQISAKCNDINTFNTLFFPRTSQEVAEAKEANVPIYSIYMGDLAWDNYWYKNSFAHPSYKALYVNQYNSYKMKHFSVIGNHDHDGAVYNSDSVDFMAAAAFRQYMGPNYYSFNVGKIHFLVLDDIIYKNEDDGSTYSKGIVGTRNYTEGFTYDQVNFAKRDLAMVDKDATVFLCVHAPLYYISNASQTTTSYNRTLASQIEAAMKPFKQVHILSGHRHVNYNMNPTAFPNFMEHSLNQIGGDLYAASYYTYLCGALSPQNVGRPVSSDGCPGAYQMFYFYGDSITWRFKALENDNEGQFHVFDGNSIKNFWNNDATMKELCVNCSDISGYASLANNSIIINVFNYDPQWKVEAFQGTKSLSVNHYKCRAPYHIMTYDYHYYKYYGKANSDPTGNGYHHFIATATDATSPVTVKVTDRFGNTYTRTITRPYDLSLDNMVVGEGTEKVVLTGLDKKAITPTEALIKVNGSDIMVDALKAGNAQITTIDGKSRIVSVVAGKNYIPVMQKGINIITIDGKSRKVYVK